MSKQLSTTLAYEPTVMDIVIWVIFVGIITIPVYVSALLLVGIFLRRKMDIRFAGIGAILIVGMLSYLLPMRAHLTTESNFRVATGSDFQPAGPVVLEGNILLDSVVDDPQRYRDKGQMHREAKSCGTICRALLLTPGVRSVTVEPPHLKALASATSSAIAYRISKLKHCGADVSDSRDFVAASNFNWPPDRQVCIIAEPARGRFDFRLRATTARIPEQSLNSGHSHLVPNLFSQGARISRFEIHDGAGRIVLRETAASARQIKLPLMIAWSLDLRPPNIGFFATELQNKPLETVDTLTLLQRDTNIAARWDQGGNVVLTN